MDYVHVLAAFPQTDGSLKFIGSWYVDEVSSATAMGSYQLSAGGNTLTFQSGLENGRVGTRVSGFAFP